MRVLCVRHSDGAEDDRVTTWCRLNGLEPDQRRPFKGQDAGTVKGDVAAVVIYGGMYNAYDTELHPFLRDEYKLIEEALAADIPLLGICQGAQMIARALGAWAGAPEHGSHEFGYYEVSPVTSELLPQPLYVTQAHFHTFDLPDGAVHLARSALFENQAFRFGRAAYGFQFHAECTLEGFRRWQSANNTSYGQPGAQDRDTQDRLSALHDKAQADWFYGFLDKFVTVDEVT